MEEGAVHSLIKLLNSNQFLNCFSFYYIINNGNGIILMAYLDNK